MNAQDILRTLCRPQSMALFCLLLAPYGNPLYSCALDGGARIISLVPHELESALRWEDFHDTQTQ